MSVMNVCPKSPISLQLCHGRHWITPDSRGSFTNNHNNGHVIRSSTNAGITCDLCEQLIYAHTKTVLLYAAI